MLEESFIRDINEERRRNKIRFFLCRYVNLLTALILILIVVGVTITFQGYSFMKKREAAQLGDDFLSVLNRAKEANYDETIIRLDEIIAKSSFTAYSALAEMRKASILGEKGEKETAVKMFDHIATSAKVPEIVKNMARIRAAYLLIDISNFPDIEQRIKKFATDIDPMRLAARDILGLSAWKAGEIGKTLYYFNKIYEDKEALGSGFYIRARMFLDLLQAIGVVNREEDFSLSKTGD